MRPPRRCLVTGGAGFIGSHLADRLLAEGCAVTVLDDLSTGHRANLEGVEAAGGRVVVGDAADPALVRELMAEADAVFHLAAAVGVRLVVERPVEAIERNLEPTRVVLAEAGARRVPVVLTSSSEVYGRSANERFSEEDDLVLGPPSRPRWAYACSKLMDEFLALAWHAQHGLPVTVVRLFNTVGPRQRGRWGMVLPRFCAQARAGGPITVYGDGSQRRCFTWVGDVAEALVALCGHPRAAGRVVNLGADREISIRELAQRVRAQLNPAAGIETVPYQQVYGPGFDDMPRRRPDTALAEELVGWAPSKGLDEIIGAVAAWQEAGA
jgi:UDP-glucose 4-epimerase